MNDAQKQGRDRLQAVLEETVDLLGPHSHTYSDGDEVPEAAPFIVLGWTIGIEYAQIDEDGELATWTICTRAQATSNAHAIGLALSIIDQLKP